MAREAPTPETIARRVFRAALGPALLAAVGCREPRTPPIAPPPAPEPPPSQPSAQPAPSPTVTPLPASPDQPPGTYIGPAPQVPPQGGAAPLPGAVVPRDARRSEGRPRPPRRGPRVAG